MGLGSFWGKCLKIVRAEVDKGGINLFVVINFAIMPRSLQRCAVCDLCLSVIIKI